MMKKARLEPTRRFEMELAAGLVVLTLLWLAISSF